MKILVTFALIALAACTNITQTGGISSTTNTLTNPAYTTSSTSYTHTVQNVNITALTTGSPPDLNLALSVVAGALPLTQFCAADTVKPCVCVLTWTELNTVGGGSSSVSRTKKLPVTGVQTGLVNCTMTQAFWNEIANGTGMQMTIAGVSPNSTGINVQAVGYKKGTSIAPAGDFVDNTLTPFRNIYRYTCFSKRPSMSYEVMNSYTQASPAAAAGATPPPVNTMIASVFCAQAGANCQNPRNGYSAQSYYRNLFIRSDKLGEINSTNARYDCPKVFESLSYSATNPASVPAAEQGKYWPLDTTFAVATTSSSDWSVQIPAATTLMKSGDATAVDDAGIAATDRLKEFATSNAGIAWKIMGYGKPPNADGTCGSIVDSNGRTRPLTRLRRYRVVYPTAFQNTGQVVQENPEGDQVYISDRLVVDGSGNLTGNMIYGPKPCNFSWFDHEGVTNRTTTAAQDFQTNFTGTTAGSSSWPTYRATSEYYYKKPVGVSTAEVDVNPDGRVLPNIDRDGTVGGLVTPSCSAAISIYDSDATGLVSTARLVTSYYNRTDAITLGARKFYLGEIHLNPMGRWSPDYVEDTSFKACVPVSDPYLEPPLHFYRNTLASGGNVSWCAKVYPTQNPYWLDLNARKKPLTSATASVAMNWGNVLTNNNTALVNWFTSHVKGAAGLDSLNSCTSTAADQICTWSLGSTTATDYPNCLLYLGNALANAGAVNNRCDRSVMFDVNQDYRGFPLQASDADIQSMLVNDAAKDKNYSCNYSVNKSPSKVNVSQPISNCCGVRSGTSILDPSVLPYSTIPTSGHLEPYINNAFPTIRFCGNPVE